MDFSFNQSRLDHFELSKFWRQFSACYKVLYFELRIIEILHIDAVKRSFLEMIGSDLLASLQSFDYWKSNIIKLEDKVSGVRKVLFVALTT